MPTLYILIGAPGSGKTTWARKKTSESNLWNHISRDEIRFSYLKDGDDYWANEKQVYAEFVNNIVYSLSDPSSHNIIADASHLNEKSRAKLLKAVSRKMGNQNYKIVFVYFNIPIKECLRRNSGRIGRANVPEDCLIQMYNSMTFPNINECSEQLSRIEIVRE